MSQNIMNELTKEQIKELEMLATEIEAEALQMKLDYEATGSEHSGSVVFVNQHSPLLENESEELGTTMVVSSAQHIKKRVEEGQEGEKDD